jgi:hypothetical protein
MNLKFLAGLLLMGATSNAAMYATWGVGVGHPEATASPDKNKFIEVGTQISHDVFDSRIGLGGWMDKSGYEGVRNSGYVQYQLGVETRKTGAYAAYFIGPALIQNKDSLLGSHFQISQSIEIGLADIRGVTVCLIARHFSNAGMTAVNKGRNFVGPQIRF